MPGNNHCDIIKIILIIIIFVIVIQIYNIFYKSKYGDYFKSIKIADVPDSVKCFFKEPQCEEGNIDGWSIVHALLYFGIGLVFPGHYITIIVISIIYEIIQPYLGNQPRYIINPLINLTGYSLGSVASKKFSNFREKYQVIVKD